jgi:hypothetical protein
MIFQPEQRDSSQIVLEYWELFQIVLEEQSNMSLKHFKEHLELWFDEVQVQNNFERFPTSESFSRTFQTLKASAKIIRDMEIFTRSELRTQARQSSPIQINLQSTATSPPTPTATPKPKVSFFHLWKSLKICKKFSQIHRFSFKNSSRKLSVV